MEVLRGTKQIHHFYYSLYGVLISRLSICSETQLVGDVITVVNRFGKLVEIYDLIKITRCTDIDDQKKCNDL